MIRYQIKVEDNDFIKVCDLYKKAGWWDEPCSAEQISTLIANSFCFFTAWEEDKLVGMGRVISDSFSDAYIQDVYVAESHRKQGIAGNIVRGLIDYCQENNIHWIALIAAPGSEGIYKKLGFEKMKDHTPMQFLNKPARF